jgi:hypothetical protein
VLEGAEKGDDQTTRILYIPVGHAGYGKASIRGAEELFLPIHRLVRHSLQRQ